MLSLLFFSLIWSYIEWSMKILGIWSSHCLGGSVLLSQPSYQHRSSNTKFFLYTRNKITLVSVDNMSLLHTFWYINYGSDREMINCQDSFFPKKVIWICIPSSWHWNLKANGWNGQGLILKTWPLIMHTNWKSSSAARLLLAEMYFKPRAAPISSTWWISSKILLVLLE